MGVLRPGMCPGLDENLLRDLKAADVRTVEELVSTDVEDLARRCSVSYKALLVVRRVLLAQLASFPVSGADLYQELLSSTAIISTGNPSLDLLLDSGLYTGEVTELAGGPGSGKSQVCMGVAVQVSLHLRQKVVYVDTSGGLSAGRLLEMLGNLTENGERRAEALQRIHVVRVFDVFSLLDRLYELRAHGLLEACGAGGSVKALILDSASAVMVPLLGGKHREGMALMVQVGNLLKTMSKDFNMAVLVTNHVTRSAGGVQPGLGLVWSHVPRTRVLLDRDRATLSKSSRRVGTSSWMQTDHNLLENLPNPNPAPQPCSLTQKVDLAWSSRDGPSAKRKLDRTES